VTLSEEILALQYSNAGNLEKKKKKKKKLKKKKKKKNKTK